MIRVKESLSYLADFIQVSTSTMGQPVSLSPETLRKSKLNDPSVVDEMVKLLVQLIGVLENFNIKEGSPQTAYVEILNLYLSLNRNPFVIEIRGDYFFNLGSSRELLKILCWLLFSNKKLLEVLDKELCKSFYEIKVTELMKEEKGESKTPEKSKVQQIDDINEILQLKTIFFLKLDAVKSLQESQAKKLSKVLGSLQATIDKDKSDSGLSKLSPGTLLNLVSSPDSLESLTSRQEPAERLSGQISHRGAILDWQLHCLEEARRESTADAGVAVADWPAAGLLGQRVFATRVVELSSLYNESVKVLGTLTAQADKVRAFGEFWAKLGDKMKTNPEFKKVIGTVVGRETNRLATKYKKESAENENVVPQIDLFKVLVDLKASGKQSTSHTEVKISQGHGEAQAQATIDRITNEYDSFVDEVKDFLLARGIKTKIGRAHV